MSDRDANRWIITLAVMLPTLIEILDTSVANVLCPIFRAVFLLGRTRSPGS